MDDPRASRDVERTVEALVERHVDELIAGRVPDLEASAAALTDPLARARFRGQALAQEYLVRAAGDAPVELAAYRGRLASDAERQAFEGVLRDEDLARASLPGELLTGQCLDGRYEIRRKVGQGGMGAVYAALDHELEREVAVKVLRTRRGADAPGWAELFRRESKTLARLASTNIVTIHDAVHGAEHVYIVMDLVRGKDLQRVLEEVRALGEGHAAPAGSAFMRQAVGRAQGGERDDLLGDPSHARCVARILHAMAVTLEHAHAANVIHRDLKPQNVMLLPGGEPVLLDFGLASWGAEGTEEGFRGTPEYLAPEQIERLRAGNDPRTDVYQLGLVLYEMLALRRAYRRGEREELWPLFERIQNGERTPLAELAPRAPRALRAIADRAMEREPARRYQTMAALREDLERFLAGLPPRQAELPAALRLALRAGWVARRPATAVVGAAALAAALFLRTPPWVPPVVAAFKAEASQVARLEDGDKIELADVGVLGLDLEAEDTTWLYVFQLYGSSEDDKRAQFLHPVHPLALADYVAGAAPEGARGVRFEPGNHQLACAELEEPKSFEGLVVYASPEPDGVLEDWQRTLLELEAELGGAVSMSEAEQHLENLRESVRGEPLGTISLEARRRAVGNVLAAEKEGTIPRKYRFLHRVERRSLAKEEDAR